MIKICMMTFVLCWTCISSMSMCQDIDKSPEAVEKWLDQLSDMKEKRTKLHFFLHETNGGTYGKTIYPVVQPNISLTSSTSFGRVSMFDDPLKEELDPESKIIGRAQGSTSSASLEEFALLMTFNFVFTSGEYNDSSLSVMGRNPLFNQYREFVIVGGSGVFRLAKGVVTAETRVSNSTTRDIIIEYNVVAIHY